MQPTQPVLANTQRPWTRWWWLGSAASEAEITRQLELFHAAGIGGVEISPIYGVEGQEARNVPYLSERWIELLRYAAREATRLGLGVDLICGSGWPFGGTWVRDEDAAARVLFERYNVAEGGTLTQPIRSSAASQAALQAVIGYANGGTVLDLTAQVDATNFLNWIAPRGTWEIYALFQTGTGQQVKRAAPGAEGNVVDHFSADAVARFLSALDQPLAALAEGEALRCVFNDSYEVYGANWTSDLLAQFAQRRGYDLLRELPALCGQGDAERVRRVRADYRHTISDLMIQAFVEPWTAWAHARGYLSRNQAHGSPGNLLDLYAAADIPETETFGPDWMRLAGLTPMPGTPPQQGGRADVLIGKLASSAAHVAGKPLCSSESFTWLDEHGKVPLAHMKAEVDVAFVMGINHLFFHGTPFSPADVAWPGWVFYATTHVAPTNPWWRDLPALNAYIAHCQAWLQTGTPDNDLLLYFPIYDLWATEHGAQDMLHFQTVHSEHWLDDNLADFSAAAHWLWDRGYSFDFVSDQQLEQAIHVAEQQLKAHGATYRALVVAGCALMPPETLERIVALAEAGATVLFVGVLPQDVPGLGDLEARRARLRVACATLGSLGAGRVLIGDDLAEIVDITKIRRETIVDAGVEFIRRRDDADTLYFLANFGQQRIDQWVSLATAAETVSIVDPLSQRTGIARSERSERETRVYLQLAPGESLLLRAHAQANDGSAWPYVSPIDAPQILAGEWQIAFTEGGPILPHARRITQLASWTEWSNDHDAVRAFSGTARYTISFARPNVPADAWLLDLGAVCHSARVRLNGRELGVLFARPFELLVTDAMQDGDNVLEIEVTNLMANRLVDMDRRGEVWRHFFFVNIKYQQFDASGWEPLPSGLLGPVRLAPLRVVSHPDTIAQR